MNHELKLNKIILFIILFITLYSCKNDKSNGSFCETNFIITDDNYNFFEKNKKHFLSCNYISFMRINKSRLEKSLRYLLESDSLKGLSISLVDLKELPITIRMFNRLEKLEITNCNLKNIPNYFLTFNRLKSLKLMNNKLVKVPYIKSLTYLNISNNNFRTFPYSYFDSNKITTICIENNDLSYIDVGFVKKRNLKILSLSGNKIEKKSLDSLFNILGDSVIITRLRLVE